MSLNIPLPDNIYLGIGSFSNWESETVEKILRGGMDVPDILVALSRHWKIKVWFSSKVNLLRVRPHAKYGPWEGQTRTVTYGSKNIETDCHVFTKLNTFSNGSLCYQLTRRSRKFGYYFPPLSLVVKYEPLIKLKRR